MLLLCKSHSVFEIFRVSDMSWIASQGADVFYSLILDGFVEWVTTAKSVIAFGKRVSPLVQVENVWGGRHEIQYEKLPATIRKWHFLRPIESKGGRRE